jgi:citrate lyase subunit beta / citryl-CoA lyase
MNPRSYLFVPGNRSERFAKAYSSGADAVIIDLEDAVPPGERAVARANAAAWVSPEHPVLIRVNGATTEWFRDDIAMCRMPGIAGVVLPKAERTEDIERIGKPVLPIIETAHGFWNVFALAHTPNVERLLFGSIDFQVDLGIHGEDEELLYFRSQLVLVSRLAGLPAPVDGITAVFDSADPVRADTQRARRLGFGGKLCIHPKQIATVNQCFGPTADEEAWARRVIEAAATAGGAAISLDGEMIDRPVLARALEMLKQLREP